MILVPTFGVSRTIAGGVCVCGGVVWFDACVRVRIDGEYGFPGATFGVLVV